MNAPGVGLGACYTWKRDCYPVPDSCGSIQNLQVPQSCPETQTWFWVIGLAIAIGAAVFGGSGGKS